MKELSIEQKAKAYDEVIDKVAHFIKKYIGFGCMIHPNSSEAKELLNIFPELKESEDERIRKALIVYLRSILSNKKYGDKFIEAWIAWLEKQGEQKSKKVSLWKHWKDGIAGNGEGKPIYLIKDGYTYSISSCLGFECDYIELSELDKLLSEKQCEQKPYGQREECLDCQVNYAGECKGSCAMKRGKQNLANSAKTCKDEQKHTDKVEPKFKVGDWVANTVGNTNQVVKVLDDGYTLDDNTFLSNSWVTEHYHLWTIQDAKDGDVLYMDNGLSTCTFIYKSINNVVIQKYASYNKFGFEGTTYLVLNDGYVCPATKEQRDTLIKAMADAGYTFDFEKKELKKVENKNPLLSDFFKDEYERGKADAQKSALSEEDENKPNGGIVMEDFNGGNGFYKVNLAFLNEEQVEEIEELVKRWNLQLKGNEDDSIISDLLDYFDEDMCLKHEVNDVVRWLKTIKLQQKQGWGVNEVKMLDNLITYLNGRKDLLEEIKCTYISWLKSLKERVQPQQDWSEEDKKMIGNIRRIIEQYAFFKSAVDVNGELCEKEYIDADNWLKSLSPQNRWKPSDEQMEVLLGEAVAWTEGCPKQKILESLYNDLKKLKEE